MVTDEKFIEDALQFDLLKKYPQLSQNKRDTVVRSLMKHAKDFSQEVVAVAVNDHPCVEGKYLRNFYIKVKRFTIHGWFALA